jgi:hypothetical protein
VQVAGVKDAAVFLVKHTCHYYGKERLCFHMLSMASNEMVHGEKCMNMYEKVTKCSVIAV